MLAQLQRLVVASWCWGRRHPYFFAAMPVVLALSISFLMREDSEWETVYVVAANHLRAGADICTDGNSYPPFAAFAALPVSFLGPSLLRLTWLVANLVCLAVMVRGAWQVAGGGHLQGVRRAPLGEHLGICKTASLTSKPTSSLGRSLFWAAWRCAVRVRSAPPRVSGLRLR
jgi:hypothetical protein